MAQIDEIAPDLYRVSIYVPQFDLQFNHFLIKDDEPLLFHTGMRRMFPEVLEAVATLIDPADLRWISWSHFEVDECGALNEWLAVAPHAQAVCSQVGAAVNIDDFANRPPRGLTKDEVIDTGRHRYRFVPTPHLPHGWDAGVLFEENSGVLLCSDLFHQIGDVEPVTSTDILGRWDAAIAAYQQHPVLMDYVPLTSARLRAGGRATMTAPGCHRVGLAELSDYAAGELADTEAAAIEEHLFACTDCSARAADFDAIVRAIPAAVRSADVGGFVTDAVLNRLEREGVRVRTYSLSPGAVVPCAVWDGDEVMALRLRGDFGSATEFALLQRAAGTELVRVTGQIIPSSYGEVIYTMPAESIRHLPVVNVEILLTALDDGVERLVGTYTLVHGGSLHR